MPSIWFGQQDDAHHRLDHLRTDAAFAERLQASLGITPAQLLTPAKKAILTEIMQYHIVPAGALLSTQLKAGQKLTTSLARAEPLVIKMIGGAPNISTPHSDAGIVVPNIKFGKSVVHVIDDVLEPADLGKAEVGEIPYSASG
ncbi:hypothetical protein OEZ86_007498 [Tetradesmus obliquus]|nr:hypothetical protein OEZ86_007498 [Tetradesmus obliquus]